MGINLVVGDYVKINTELESKDKTSLVVGTVGKITALANSDNEFTVLIGETEWLISNEFLDYTWPKDTGTAGNDSADDEYGDAYATGYRGTYYNQPKIRIKE